MLVLSDPQEQMHEFSYRNGGVGMAGIRLPSRFRLPDIKLPNFITKNGTIAGTGATRDFDGGGVIYRLRDKELKPEDFSGMTLWLDGSAGLLVAGGGSIFVAGLDQRLLVPWLFNPGIFGNLLFARATALVILGGDSEGLIDGASFGLMIGHISYHGGYTE